MGLEVTKEKRKINALLIARRPYKNLLSPLNKDYDISVRKIIGRKKSLAVLNERLKKYSEETFFIIDINAVTEKRDKMAEQLKAITKKRDDIHIVLFAPDAKPGNPDLDYLIQCGFTNIIADTANNSKNKWNKVIDDLCTFFECQCLYPEEVAQFINPKPNPQIIALSDCADGPDETEERDEHIAIPNFSGIYATVNFYGTQKRIGTTTAALMTAAYFAKGKAVPLVFLGSKKEYERLTTFYSKKTTVTDCITEINNIYITFIGAPLNNIDISFNILINDKGVFHEIEEEKSINVVVGGVNYNEIANTIKIHEMLNKNQADYISMVSFAEGKSNYNITDKQSVILPYATDITFFPGSVTAMFNSVFGKLISDE